MITAVDTNVLLDVLLPDEPFRLESSEALSRVEQLGPVLASDAVLAEIAAQFDDASGLSAFLSEGGISRSGSGVEALHRAGQAWAAYAVRRPRTLVCPRCGASNDVRCTSCGSLIQVRQHLVADFLIGAHAVVHADGLLTRDRGFYATYFPELRLL